MSSQPEDQESSLSRQSQPVPPVQPAGKDKPLTPGQEAARLRRERRNAKIQSGGSARLDAISRLSGRRGVGSDDGMVEKEKEKENDGDGGRGMIAFA